MHHGKFRNLGKEGKEKKLSALNQFLSPAWPLPLAALDPGIPLPVWPLWQLEASADAWCSCPIWRPLPQVSSTQLSCPWESFWTPLHPLPQKGTPSLWASAWAPARGQTSASPTWISAGPANPGSCLLLTPFQSNRYPQKVFSSASSAPVLSTWPPQGLPSTPANAWPFRLTFQCFTDINSTLVTFFDIYLFSSQIIFPHCIPRSEVPKPKAL